MVNKPLIRPYFLGGGVALDSHDKTQKCQTAQIWSRLGSFAASRQQVLLVSPSETGETGEKLGWCIWVLNQK